MRFRVFGFWLFDIVWCFGFRVSDLYFLWRNTARTTKGCFLKAPSFVGGSSLSISWEHAGLNLFQKRYAEAGNNTFNNHYRKVSYYEHR